MYRSIYFLNNDQIADPRVYRLFTHWRYAPPILYTFHEYLEGGGGQGCLIRHFPSKMHRWCLVCVIWNSHSFHSFISRIMTYTEWICAPLILCTFDKYQLIFEGFWTWTLLRLHHLSLQCVILFKPCILIPDILTMRTNRYVDMDRTVSQMTRGWLSCPSLRLRDCSMHGMVTFADVLHVKLWLCFASLCFCSSVLTPLAALPLLASFRFSTLFRFVAKAVFLWVSAHCNLNVKKQNFPSSYKTVSNSSRQIHQSPCWCSLLGYTFYLLIS